MKLSAPARQAELTWTPPGGQPRRQAATVVGLDERAVRLIIGEELPLDQACQVALLNRDGQCQVRAEANVHYLRALRGEKRLSCRWSQPLSQRHLDLLTAAGLYERRLARRAPIALEAPAWPELTELPGVIPVRIVDLSVGGCCIKSPQAVPVGQRLMIRVWGENCPVAAVRMRVKWQQPLSGEVLLGCEFMQRAGYATLSSIVQQESCASAKAGLSLRGRRSGVR